MDAYQLPDATFLRTQSKNKHKIAIGYLLDMNRYLLIFLQRFSLPIAIFILATIFLLDTVQPAGAAVSQAQRSTFQKNIIDYRWKLHPKYKRVKRKRTKYIIVHTSEGGLGGTLHVVSRGKVVGKRRRTYGGHANYVIARDGRTYRTLDKKYVADHAGLSMWNGGTDISKVSIGIELAGYHYAPITQKQYRSLATLIKIMQNVYGLNDRAVLTHSQVAYGRPNRWFKRNHRGRKRCAKNFDRYQAALGAGWGYDPDVKARRLTPDKELAAIFYSPKKAGVAQRIGSNVITKNNSAWAIAGEDYNAASTIYKLPDGRLVPGNQFEKKVGWNRMPVKTVVLLNQKETGTSTLAKAKGPIKTITDGLTAYTLAGSAYKKETTFYFFPNGSIKSGRQITDWDDLPVATLMILGYKSPQKLTASRQAIKIAGSRYNHKNTLYYFPGKGLISGNQIKSFKSIPSGVLVFVPKRI
jgi:N-acetylmuramoyl-L-alanine amidase